jgi:hypothetical protein
VLVPAAVDPDRAEREIIETHAQTLGPWPQALFFEVIAVKVDQRCSTCVLPQCGQRISPSS